VVNVITSFHYIRNRKKRLKSMEEGIEDVVRLITMKIYWLFLVTIVIHLLLFRVWLELLGMLVKKYRFKLINMITWKRKLKLLNNRLMRIILDMIIKIEKYIICL